MERIAHTQADAAPRVVIVGGGITGLSAAYYLQQEAQRNEMDMRYTLVESSARLGGKILTEHVEGFGDEPFIVEAGPDSFLTQKPWALQLARDLGMSDQLLGTNDRQRRVFVLNRGRPTPLPDGVMLIVPTRIMPFLRSPLLSLWGKLRMGLDLFIPAKTDDADESLADFIRRRLGSEALDKIAEPLMAGIYNAEAERQSLLATFPRFREIEMKHGSLIRGMVAARTARPTPPPNGAQPTQPVSAFVSFRLGTQELVTALERKLTGDIRRNATVAAIEPLPGSRYVVTTYAGERIQADAVLLTTPAGIASSLVRALAPDAGALLASIRCVSTGTVSLAYRRSDVRHPLDGFGLVIPRSEKRPINAITWTSTKFTHRAPEGHALIRLFFGGSRNPQMMALDDDALLQIVTSELRDLMQIDATPLFHRIYCWFDANPQYDSGHLDLVAAIESSLPQGIFVAGSPYRGIGIPDCVHQGQQAAAHIAQLLRAGVKVPV